ncbi:type II secretion system protein GspH [Stutzerimonas nosocomialis]|uniref:Type II secretion system protein H n=1 Tax=Stutzerimonas nosocomialis TaxID=1056496 RepID=A0A5R9QCH8_9GAMM|nr:type II secretion system minor pseudopilin GspH [Stutzerimonas nosocomialis]TLX57664.1 type II secretion system protein GspH [Stutzerimonas nosocomialis]TLX59147.1 type II secretion system protein GspH [Stutzerimonas nosocomialis]TLX62463.1 type II secretion system protein GspH [Stutzerimonas nosocomialis]
MLHGRRAAGFTLIELMVVLVILGTLISLAVLSTGSASSARELRDEAQRIAAVIGLLADEAVLDSREYGLLIDDEGYRVLRYDDAQGRWVDDGARGTHRLPSWARLDLALDGTPLRLLAPVRQGGDRAGLSRDEDEEQRKREAARLQPQLLILSSGELSPFSLRVSERRPDGNAWVVASDGFALPEAVPAQERR